MANEPETDKAPKVRGVEPPPTAKPGRKSNSGPKGGTDKKPKSSTTRKPSGRPIALEKELTELFGFVGLMVSNFNQRDGEIIVQNAEALGKSWATLAKEDARVKRFLDSLTTGNAWGQVVFATGTMAFAIAQNHGFMSGTTDGDGTGEPGGFQSPTPSAPVPPSPPRVR